MLDQQAIDAIRHDEIAPRDHLIEGQSVPSQSGATRDAVSPIDGRVLTQLAEGGAGDMDRAVASARAAYQDGRWSGQPPAARKRVLMRLTELTEREALALAVMGVRENGTEINMAYKAEALSAAGTFRYYAEAIDKVYGEIAPTAGDVLGLVHRAPVGVVGAIVPWNFPLMIGAWKLGPALAMATRWCSNPPRARRSRSCALASLRSRRGCRPGFSTSSPGRVRWWARRWRCRWRWTCWSSPARVPPGGGCWIMPRART